MGKVKHDKKIGFVVISTLNYGNQLVNFALFQIFQKLGYQVSMIYPPSSVDENYRTRKNLFLRNPYIDDNIIEVTDFHSLIKLNEWFDIFIVGGDQQFRYIFAEGTKEFSYLDWVHWSKKKFSVGTSFGTNYYENLYPYIVDRMGYWLQRFQSISVREQSGVELLNEQFGIQDAKKIVDPVFLCEPLYVKQLARETKINQAEGIYIGAYLLDMTNNKKCFLQQLAKQYCDGKYQIIRDAGAILEPNKSGLEYDSHTLYDAKVEDWLAMIDGCELLLTDSFHGVCMALLLKKPFCVTFEQENWRGFARIKEILFEYALEDRIVTSYKEYLEKGLDKKQIDFEYIHNKIQEKRMNGIEWIKETIEKEMSFKEDPFYKWYINKSLKFNPLPEDGDFTYIAWGAGNFFLANEDKIRENDVQYVCDQNSEKWGKEIVSGIRCINIEELKKIKKVVVLITIDNWQAEQEIVKKVGLLDNVIGITHLRMLK